MLEPEDQEVLDAVAAVAPDVAPLVEARLEDLEEQVAELEAVIEEAGLEAAPAEDEAEADA